MPERYQWPKDAAHPQLLRRLCPQHAALPQSVSASARDIIADVRRRGDAALIEYAARFDAVTLETDALRIAPEAIEASARRAQPKLRDALARVADQVRRFHEPQVTESYSMPGPGGGTVGLMWRPVEAAGLYVPGGRAAYPSTVIMNAVPAQVAGVPRLAVFTVPG
ncbi:unnamed protein product, partial [Laminaria digitata]